MAIIQAGITTLNEFFKEFGDKLKIPSYQRPYEWDNNNVKTLLYDFDYIIKQKEINGDDYRYRLGTIILCKNKDDDEKEETYKIVDGQQRLITCSIVNWCICENRKDNENNKKLQLLKNSNFKNENSKKHLYNNYHLINQYFANRKDDYMNRIAELFEKNIEFVVIVINEISEAFQLFDSQNARGKDLYPHDLLKAYHLREMNCDPEEAKLIIEEWNDNDYFNQLVDGEDKAEKIYNFFNQILFPIYNWVNKISIYDKKGRHNFSKNDIGIYKGVRMQLDYNYVKRIAKCEPEFQLNDQFISGKSFFNYVKHYSDMYRIIKSIIRNKIQQGNINDIYGEKQSKKTHYSIALFESVLMCYYDRFGKVYDDIFNLLYIWAFQIRVDMTSLKFATVNKYALGLGNVDDYTNNLPMFNMIVKSKLAYDIFAAEVKKNDENNKIF